MLLPSSPKPSFVKSVFYLQAEKEFLASHLASVQNFKKSYSQKKGGLLNA